MAIQNTDLIQSAGTGFKRECAVEVTAPGFLEKPEEPANRKKCRSDPHVSLICLRPLFRFRKYSWWPVNARTHFLLYTRLKKLPVPVHNKHNKLFSYKTRTTSYSGSAPPIHPPLLLRSRDNCLLIRGITSTELPPCSVPGLSPVASNVNHFAGFLATSEINPSRAEVTTFGMVSDGVGRPGYGISKKSVTVVVLEDSNLTEDPFRDLGRRFLNS